MYVYHIRVWIPGALRGQNKISDLEMEVKDGFKPSCGCRDPNLGPLEEEPVLLLLNQPPLQFPSIQFKCG